MCETPVSLEINRAAYFIREAKLPSSIAGKISLDLIGLPVISPATDWITSFSSREPVKITVYPS
jgi:hypothetical protein